MAKKIQQYYIAKINANKIVAENYQLNYTLKDLRVNEELVSIGDSQVLRVIRRLVGRETDYEDLNFLIKEKNRLKRRIKKYNEQEEKNKLFEVLRKIDEYLYIPEYVSIVSENKTQYEGVAKKRSGFWINGKKYKRFMCSAGNARTNTVVFIREDLFKPLVKILQNGHKEVEIAEAKYNTYFSLASSATFMVSTPKVVVVPDCKVTQNEVIDKVDLINNEYKVERKEEPVTFNVWDGMGLISPEQAKVWAQELELDYVPSGFLIRAPFIKGMVFVFDFHKFAYEVAGKKYIKDIYGNEIHVDDVEVIITQSQFKLWEGWNSWKDYVENLEKNKLSFGVTKFPPKFDKDSIRTNYQFVQVLNLDDEGIKELCEPTAKWLEGVVGGNEDYVKLYLLGKMADYDNVDEIWNNLQDNFLKGLLINSEIKNDKYIQSKINQSIQKKIKESYIGKLIVDGNFQVMINDPYALCEWVFGMEVKGLLARDEYYSDYWNKKGVDIVAGMRSPLTWRSEVNKMKLKDNEELEEWYKYLYSGIVYNIHGCDTLIHAGSDFD